MKLPPRVALVFVPQGEPSMPHLAQPQLRAYLKCRTGIEADLFDCNLPFYRQLFSGEGVRALTRLCEARGLFVGNRMLRSRLARLARDISVARDVIDGSDFDRRLYAFALDTLADACALFGLAHPPYELSLKNLAVKGWDGSSAALQRLVEDAGNPFASCFAPFLDKLATYDVVGLTLAWTGQVVPLFVLARLLKQRKPEMCIVLGGSLVPHLLDGLLAARELMRNIDLVVPFEGEDPLADIVERVTSGQDPAAVAGVISVAAMTRAPRMPPSSAARVAVERLPPPDFSGLPIEAYLSPRACLPVMASRGCYYGQCGFCDHFHHVKNRFSRSIAEVMRDIEALQERHGVRHFFFVDDCMPVATLRRLGAALRADPGKDIHFMAEMRLEPALTRAVLDDAERGGCHALLFGLESGCQGTLDRMGKGTAIGTARRILADAHQAGILTWCFFMAGYPGESLDDVAATMRFLIDGREDIDAIAGGPFVMTRAAPIAHTGALPGLQVDAPASDLSLELDWRHPASPDRQALDLALAAADHELGMAYPRLASFIEAHALAFRQEEWRALRARTGRRPACVGPGAARFRVMTWIRAAFRLGIP